MRLLTGLSVVLIVLGGAVAHGQWVQTNGPYGGVVTCFAFSGADVFVGTLLGIYHSSDNGASWHPAGLPDFAIPALLSSGNRLFAAAGGLGAGIFVSTDEGTSWTAADDGLSDSAVSALASSGPNIFAGTGNGHVFRSTDNGQHWTGVFAGVTGARIGCFAVNGTYLFAGTWGGGLYASGDGGATWAPADSGLPPSANVYVLVPFGSSVLAGTSSGLYGTDRNGAFWYASTLPVGVVALCTSGTNIIAGTLYEGLMISPTDVFGIWISIGAGLTNQNVSVLAVDGTEIFAGTEGAGAFLSTDNGVSWNAASNGIRNVDVTALLANSNSVLAGTNGAGIFRSTDNGSTWSPTASGVGTSPYVNCLLADGANVLAGEANGVVRSTDGGMSWSVVGNGLPQKGALSLAAFGIAILRNRVLFAGFAGGAYISKDDGNTWTAAGLSSELVWAFAAADSFRFAATYHGIFRSTDNDTTWSASSSGLTNQYVNSLVAIPAPGGTGGDELFAGTAGGIFRSTDDGTNWMAADAGITENNIARLFAIEASGQTRLFAGAYGGSGVYLSTDYGTSWAAVNTGLPAFSGVPALATGPGPGGTGNQYLYAGTVATGVWRRPLSEMITSIPQPAEAIPTQFGLEQNYPNPFNPSTEIGYRVQGAGYGVWVTLMVYDVLGREVATLVNERKQPGRYTVRFDGAGMASGVYLYRLTAGASVATKKLVLLR